MAVSFTSTKLSGRMNPFWREPKILPGGFNLAQTFPAGTFIKRGALVAANFSNMTANIVKVAKVLAGGTTTKPRIEKDNYFVVGDEVMVVSAEGATAKKAISAIDSSNDDYDVLTLASSLSGATEGAFLQQVSGSHDVTTGSGQDETTTTYYDGYVPNMVLGADRDILASQLATLDVAYDALVLADVVPSFPSSWLVDDSPCLKTNPNILFIKQ